MREKMGCLYVDEAMTTCLLAGGICIWAVSVTEVLTVNLVIIHQDHKISISPIADCWTGTHLRQNLLTDDFV